MHILFFGMPITGVPYLKVLLTSDKHKVVGLVVPALCQQRTGKWLHARARSLRGMLRRVSHVKNTTPWLAKQSGLPIWRQNLNSTGFLRYVDSLQPDLFIVASFNRILWPSILAMPPFGVINVHPSLLPKYRGADPIFWAIKNEEQRTGVTIHLMDEGIDTGPILSQRGIKINPDWDAIMVGEALDQVGADLLLQVIDSLAVGNITPRPQVEKEATYFPPAASEFRMIEWQCPSDHILRMVRASNALGGAYAQLEGKQVRVLKAEVIGEVSSCQPKPGMILKPIAGHVAFVACQDAVLRIVIRRCHTLFEKLALR